MKLDLTLTATVILFFALATSAIAQPPAAGPAIRMGNNGTPAIYRHASTLEEGFMRGLADLGRAVGDYNYNTSLAAINVEEARRRYIENQRARIEAIYEIKRMNQEWKRYNRRQLTQEERLALVKARSRKGLPPKYFDRALGRLFWPEALKSPDFLDERTAIENVIARDGVANEEIRFLVAQMSGKLISKVDTMDEVAYREAKQFLNGLEAEAFGIQGVD